MFKPFFSALPTVALSVALCLLSGASPNAQETGERLDTTMTGTLSVAVRQAPPFVMRNDQGEWSGLAIDLFERAARDIGLDFEYSESDLNALLDGTAAGDFDVGVGALTITPSREERLDFTHPFYTTGFGIAVSPSGSGWLGALFGLFSWDFLKAVALLGALLGLVGCLFWLAERHRNADQFGGSFLSGLGSGFWLSAVTMTTVGYGDKAPLTLAGRIVALVWMFTAIIIISTFTGMIASSLTADRISGSIEGPDDLSGVRVGSISGSASDEWLAGHGIGFQSLDSVDAGLDAIAAGRIDAFVYDAPLLRYLALRDHPDDVDVLGQDFGRQDYGLALPSGSALREPINRALLEYVESSEWDAALTRAFGEDG